MPKLGYLFGNQLFIISYIVIVISLFIKELLLLHHHSKCHLTLFIVLKAERAAVEADDLARDGKANARAVGLGGEEWREDIFGNLGGDSRAVVGYLYLYALLRINR